jgi:hypothetical protein
MDEVTTNRRERGEIVAGMFVFRACRGAPTFEGVAAGGPVRS